nr:AITR1 [Pongamia pinnata]
MDGRGGCCIARYATGEPHVSTVDNIMLRFRPIAPKPVAGTTASDGYSSESSDAFFKSGSKKRKYVRDNNNSKRRTRQRKTTSSPEQKNPVPMVTLPLLPETPDPKEYPARDLTPKRDDNKDNNNNNLSKNMPVWLSSENRTPAKVEPYYYFGAMDPAAVRLGGLFSCVKVECVMDTWVEGEGLGSTDEERRVNLSKDTCPGFISDGYGRVTWTNKAYGEMMGHDKCDEGEVTVLLAMKVSAVVPYPSFTCGVRVVQYACGREKNSLTVPCDVWRMDFGGFAWRLDVKAALSLRLGC